MKLSPLSFKRIELIKPKPSSGVRSQMIVAVINVQLYQPWDVSELNEGRVVFKNPIWAEEDVEKAIALFESKGWIFRSERVWPDDDNRKRLLIMAGSIVPK